MLTYHDALAKIHQGEKPWCSIITGDPLLVKELLTAISEGLPVERLSGARMQLSAVLDTAYQPSLLAASRVLLIENAPFFSGKKAYSDRDEEKLLAFLTAGKEPAANIVFTADSVDKRIKPVKTVEKYGWLVDCPPLKGEHLNRWLDHCLKRMGIKAHPMAVQELALRCGSDLMLLEQECRKIAAYLNPGEQLTAETVALLTPLSGEASVFALTDALGERKLDRAREEYERLLSQGQAPVYILHMIARHFRLLYHYSLSVDQGMGAARIGSLLELHPFVARKLAHQSRMFDIDQLEEQLLKLAGLDEQIKTGVIEPALGLGLFIAGIG